MGVQQAEAPVATASVVGGAAGHLCSSEERRGEERRKVEVE